MKRIGLFFALYFAIGIQVSISTPFAQFPWDFDLAFIILVFATSLFSRSESLLWAMLGGFMLDIFDPVSLGGHILAKTTVVLIFGLIDDSLNLSRPLLLGIVLFILSFLDRIIFRLFTPFAIHYGLTLIRFDLPSAVLTALLGFILLWIAIKIGLFLPGHYKDSDIAHL
ncbi:hypothetical protein KAH81_04105 [bacterium]|nr:hypothetical protein [bacterium]